MSEADSFPVKNDGEIHVHRDRFFDLVRVALGLPDSYTVWGVHEMSDHVAVLVESEDLEGDEYNEMIPLFLWSEENKRNKNIN